MSDHRIPFNRPAVVGAELDYVAEAARDSHLSGDGPFSRRCEALLHAELGAERVMLTPSCTSALEVAALLPDLQPGDEVIVPSFAFVTTAGAFAMHGARPVFVDVRKDTLNLDETRVADAVTDRTRAIVALHYAGVACEMDAIGRIAQEAGVVVIEDNAHGLFGRYGDRPLGSMGEVATQSFHETKNFSCGEGGALVLNRESWVQRAEILREKGTDRSKFFRGEVDKYSWVDVGGSHLPSELQAAYLLAQLEARVQVQARRMELWNRYQAALGPWALEQDALLPQVPAGCDHTAHIFQIVMPTPVARAGLIGWLRERGILSVFHYQPLHLSKMGERFGGVAGQCPVTEWVAQTLLRLPLYAALTDLEQEEVIEAVAEFRG